MYDTKQNYLQLDNALQFRLIKIKAVDLFPRSNR